MPNKTLLVFTAGANAGALSASEIVKLGRLGKRHLPPSDSIRQILIGMAPSHREVARAIGLPEEGPRSTCAAIWGPPGALHRSGHGNQTEYLFMCNGKKTGSLDFFTKRLRVAILGPEVLSGAVLCTGREAATAFGVSLTDARGIACYRVSVQEGQITHSMLGFAAML